MARTKANTLNNTKSRRTPRRNRYLGKKLCFGVFLKGVGRFFRNYTDFTDKDVVSFYIIVIL